MAEAKGAVDIKTGIDLIGIKTGIKEMLSALKGAAQSVSKISADMKTSLNAAYESDRPAEELSQEITGQFMENMKALRANFKDLSSAASTTGAGIKSVFSQVCEATAASFAEVGDYIKYKLTAAFDTSKPTEQLTADIEKWEAKLAGLESASKAANLNDDDKAAESFAKERTELYDRIAAAREELARRTEKAAEKEAKAESKSTSSLGGIFGGGKSSITSGISNATKGLTRFGSRLRRIVSGALVFNVISSGLRSMTSYLGTALTSNKQFSASLNTLKGSLLTAFQPIYEAIVPALTTLVNWLNTVVTAIAKFMAALSGKSYSTMQKNAKALNEQASATSSAGSAAKEASKQIMAFDEVNRLQSEDSSSGGGGSSSSTPIFEDTTNGVAQSLKDMADAISSFDWLGLGKKIADGLNKAIASIDWGSLGRILGASIVGLLQMIVGFIENFDFGELTAAIFAFLIGFVTEFAHGVEEVDWVEFGRSFVQAILDVINNADIGGIVSALVELFGAVRGAIAGTLYGMIIELWDESIKPAFEYWQEKLAEWWEGAKEAWAEGGFWGVAAYIIEGLLEGLAEWALIIGNWIVENILDPFIKGFEQAFGIASPSKVMEEEGGYIISGLFNGLTEKWESIKQWIAGIPQDFSSGFSKVTEWFRNTFLPDWGAIWAGLPDGVVSAVNGVISTINSMLSWVASGINALFDLLSFNINLPGVGSVGLSLPHVTAPSIPYLAQGAVIPPNAPFAAVLGDQGSGRNLEAPESLIRQIVREESGSGNNDEIVALLEELISTVGGIKVGDETIGKAAMRYQRRTNRAMGV